MRSFKLFATTPDLPISQNYSCFASKCPSKSFNFGQIFCYSTSVPISLQPHTVKTMAIWLEREKLGQICHVFQGPKNLLAILILPFFPSFHSTINKQGYSGVKPKPSKHLFSTY